MDRVENDEVIITSMRSTDVTLGLRRLPAGFYIAIHHSGREWRTQNRPSSVYHDAVEWKEPLPIPPDSSAIVRIEVYASFELQPMLGAGEQLRELTITVEQLLDHSARGDPFTFFPVDGDVVSPCASIFVTVRQWKCKSSDSSPSWALDPHCPITECQGELAEVTNQGHDALSRYRKHGEKRDLERSIVEFVRALSGCPLGHPCRAVAQSNLAMAKFILCQVQGTDVLLPLGLYRDVLRTRPVGHVDHPPTLIQLAAVHFARFQKSGNEVERARAEGMLHEAIELSSAGSHENRAATLMLKMHARHSTGPVHLDDQSLANQDSASCSIGGDLHNSSVRLLARFEQSGNLADLQESIMSLKKLIESTSVEHAQYSVALDNLGVALLQRFKHLGALSDLEDAISTLRDAIDLILHGHPNKPSVLGNLGTAFSTRFERLGELSDLENAILTLTEAVSLTSHDHPHKPSRLGNLGASFLARFEHVGQLSDLDNAISMLQDAVDQTPRGHPHKPGRLSNLGTSFKTRFDRLGGLSGVENAISTLRDAVHLTPHGHPLKASILNNLGTSLKSRFERLDKPSDIESAILTFRDAVDITPHVHPNKPRYLGNLATSFLTRFQHFGELADLESTISTTRDALNLTPHGHPHKLAILNILGTSIRIRFHRLGEISDLENAISTFRNTVELTPRGHPDKPGCLSDLGTSFITRFERVGEPSDLENAILAFRDAVDLIPRGHPDKARHLGHFGFSFFTSFECLGKPSDLENAILTLREAVDLTPHNHPDKPSRLINLGTSFSTRFHHLSELSDLENALSMFRDAVELTPDSPPHKPALLNNLGTSLKSRFEHLGELCDLENAILMFMEAVELTPWGHPDKPDHLRSLGTSFFTRFKWLAEPSDLENTVSVLRDAVDLTPPGHPDRPGHLSNFGTSIFTRFEHLGELSDLESSISTLRDAVDLTPNGDPHKPTILGNLGTSFETRFARLGELSDLESAISTLKSAVDLTPHGDPHRPHHLSNLGNSFRARFEHLGELSDIENAISMLRDAVNLTPDGRPDRPALLNNLGNALRTRFERLGELGDIENAISTLSDAIQLIPHGHPLKPGCLSNLGASFFHRFERLGELSDVEDAISTLMDAVNLTPRGHLDKPGHLSNLGASFRIRFDCLGELNDLGNAISILRDAVELAPHGHPDKPGYLNNLGSSFVVRFEHLGELSDLEHAISIYSHAASSSFGPVAVRFHASRRWISCARRIRHHSVLHAYSVAINLLPQLAWIGLSLTHRYTELMLGTNVVRNAAAAALDSGFPETAVEWLERGRSVVWGELFQLRSSHEELSSAHPDHAHRLQELSAALDHAGATREKSLSALSEQTGSSPGSLQQEADRHRNLAIERDTLLLEIRRLPGFNQFLLQKGFSQLRASAHAGPVVILNAAESRCDALIVLADVDRVIHVPLRDFTFGQTIKLQSTLKTYVRQARDGKRETQDRVGLESILFPLWRCVVKPVLDVLALSIPGDLSRVFWCPTGPFAFLPIHAAGFYGAEYSQPGHKVFDFVISSYVPTLSILTPQRVPVPNTNLRFLVVRQPPSDGLSKLPGVVTELKRVNDVIRRSPSACTTVVESSVGTVEEVLSLMKEADWVHFACHGIQDPANPTESGLCLADERRLTLHDIIALSHSQRGLAFLSACQTATGHERLSDEAIHITAGMLFAGYGGVIGTMWSISDRFAPDVARDVYEHLFRNGTRPDYREAARALHEAIGRVRNSGIVSFEEWIPFIHVGL